MKNSILLITIAVFLTTVNQSLSAQEKTVANKLIYAELCGPGIVLSANFDRRFQSDARVGFGYRIGVGYGVEKIENTLGDVIRDNMDENMFGNEDFFPYYLTSGIPLILITLQSVIRPSTNIMKGDARSFYSVPIGLNYIFGKPHRSSSLEVGAGVTLLSRKVSLYNYQLYKPGYMVGHINVMYRLMPENGGFSLRIGITPIIGTAGDFFPTGALSLGYAF